MDPERSVAQDHGATLDGDERSNAPNRARSRTRHPWEKLYPSHVDWHMPIPSGVLPELLDRARANWPDRPAIEYRDRSITFQQLADAADQLAAGLLAAGFGRGRMIALLLPNTPWHTVCFFAALKAGARLVHLSPLDAPREILFKIQDSGADALITTDLAGLASAASKLIDMGVVRHMLVGLDSHWGGPPGEAPAWSDAVIDLESLLAHQMPAAWPEIRPDDLALLQYTGGTTGTPKGAMLTHGNMMSATSIYSAWRDPSMPEPGAARTIGVLPMFHIYALGVILLLAIADGSEILLRPRFDIETTIRDIEHKRANSFPAVPTMLIALLSHPGAEARDFSALRMVGSGGAPMPHEVGQRVEAMLGQPLRTGWGMTETAAAGTRVPLGTPASAGLIGVPLCGIEMRIVDLNDPSRALPTGEVGEIAVRGPNVFSGYWNLPELSAGCFADGFFLTGDIGRMDENGLFSIVDRKKRMIISGGFNVYPAMIENAIYEHPDVEEVIVIGVPDEYRGESAKAFIKLRAGAPGLSLESLRIFLADRLGRHELPGAIELRGHLPKTAVGKLSAAQLVDEERARAAVL